MGLLPKLFWGLIIVALIEPELSGVCFAAIWLLCAGVSVWLWSEYRKKRRRK